MKGNRGFTIIELLVTLLVLSIIAAFAIPSFTNVQRSIALDSNTSKFISAVSFARSEAVTRGSTVTLCRSEDGLVCSDANADWSVGWIVYEDLGDLAVFNDDNDAVICEPGVDDCLLRVWEDGISLEGTFVEQNVPFRTSVTFDPEGWVVDQLGIEMHLRMDGCTGNEVQIFDLLPLGRVELTEGAC